MNSPHIYVDVATLNQPSERLIDVQPQQMEFFSLRGTREEDQKPSETSQTIIVGEYFRSLQIRIN